MRNDARPIGHDQSPLPHADSTDGGSASTADDRPRPTDDHRQTVTHDRQSHVINRGAAEDARRDHADPTMPTGDSTLRTNI